MSDLKKENEMLRAALTKCKEQRDRLAKDLVNLKRNKNTETMMSAILDMMDIEIDKIFLGETPFDGNALCFHEKPKVNE